MFNWFWNWADPKILKMEAWVNQKVVDVDKIDIDIDKVKKGEPSDTPSLLSYGGQTIDSEYGPKIYNLTGGEVLAYMRGPDQFEAFALIEYESEVFWRHRDTGATEDYLLGAFDNFEEFFRATHDSDKFWECVLRSEAAQSTETRLTIGEVEEYVRTLKALGAEEQA